MNCDIELKIIEFYRTRVWISQGFESILVIPTTISFKLDRPCVFVYETSKDANICKDEYNYNEYKYKIEISKNMIHVI